MNLYHLSFDALDALLKVLKAMFGLGESLLDPAGSGIERLGGEFTR